jgi:hypothetical protein
MQFNRRETAAILAGLRLMQDMELDNDGFDMSINEIATNGYTVEPLCVKEIDTLCERLNCDDRVTVCYITHDVVRQAGWEGELTDKNVRDVAKALDRALGEAGASDILKQTVEWVSKEAKSG